MAQYEKKLKGNAGRSDAQVGLPLSWKDLGNAVAAIQSRRRGGGSGAAVEAPTSISPSSTAIFPPPHELHRKEKPVVKISGVTSGRTKALIESHFASKIPGPTTGFSVSEKSSTKQEPQPKRNHPKRTRKANHLQNQTISSSASLPPKAPPIACPRVLPKAQPKPPSTAQRKSQPKISSSERGFNFSEDSRKRRRGPRGGKAHRAAMKPTVLPRQALQRQLNQPQVTSSRYQAKDQRPPPKRPHYGSNTAQAASTRSVEDWRSYIEVAVRFAGFPAFVTTKMVWHLFSVHGEISSIELYCNRAGDPDGTGRLRFMPPPKVPFWDEVKVFSLRGDAQKFRVTSVLLPGMSCYLNLPVTLSRTKYPAIMSIEATTLDFGMMYEPTTMMRLHSIQQDSSREPREMTFCLNLAHRELEVSFPLRPISDVEADDAKAFNARYYTFAISLAQPFSIMRIIEADCNQPSALLISMETPPAFFRRYNEQSTQPDGALQWRSRDAWFRETDITASPEALKVAPVSLQKSSPIIDIGRWTTFRLVFDSQAHTRDQLGVICRALRDMNIEIKSIPSLRLIAKPSCTVWDHIDRINQIKESPSVSILEELMSSDSRPLEYNVRYQLEVCISEGVLNEYNMSKDFVRKIEHMDPQQATELLEHVACQKERIFDPMTIFDLVVPLQPLNRTHIPSHCVLIRAATVTPTTVYYSTPAVETSNRVIRQYQEYSENFLRVRFTDEKPKGKIYSTDKETMNQVLTRIKRAMINGIQIGDSHFEFLAFGNSQFREHGAYFFSRTHHLAAEDIRRWMGNFEHITVVAKYASRLGMCFSTTRAIHQTIQIIEKDRDVIKHLDADPVTGMKLEHPTEYNFTDGVGKISPYLALLAANEVGVNMPTGEPPSVFQFRLGGCKGILAVCPELKDRTIHIRPSQYKFPAQSNGLEMIRWSQFSIAHLNRQLIVVLSSLGVEDCVFMEKLESQLSNLALAMTDEKLATTLLLKEVDPNQMTLTMASMVLDGFQQAHEPFMLSLLNLWRAWSIKYLKEKAKIVIHQGAVLLGCTDETVTLKGHFTNALPKDRKVTPQEKIDALPEIFVQLSKGAEGKPEVMQGLMILARNPSLHPGDIRVVRGVDVPALRHLKDVVVLPQTGDRDIASMCSGGDLDGDDYVVIWDQDMIPHEWDHPPMDYSAPPPFKSKDQVSIDDITTFFVTYIKNDSLPTIGTAHVLQADLQAEGVKSDKCIQLAALHSMAVDYPKTGQPALIPSELRPRRWPHWYEKERARKDQVYNSHKILGQIYDMVERVDFKPNYRAPFDRRILDACILEESMLIAASEVKVRYDEAMERIMAQHNIRNECEVWSTFVMQHSKHGSDFKFHEEMGHISYNLKERFRSECFQRAGGREFEKMGPFVAAMYTVTCHQVAEALKRTGEVHYIAGSDRLAIKDNSAMMPLMSFPWLFPKVLGKLATGLLSHDSEDISESINPQRVWKGKIGQHHKDVGAAEEIVLHTDHGVTHQGETLILFEDEVDDSAEASPTAFGRFPWAGLNAVNATPTASSTISREYEISILDQVIEAEDATAASDDLALQVESSMALSAFAGDWSTLDINRTDIALSSAALLPDSDLKLSEASDQSSGNQTFQSTPEAASPQELPWDHTTKPDPLAISRGSTTGTGLISSRNTCPEVAMVRLGKDGKQEASRRLSMESQEHELFDFVLLSAPSSSPSDLGSHSTSGELLGALKIESKNGPLNLEESHLERDQAVAANKKAEAEIQERSSEDTDDASDGDGDEEPLVITSMKVRPSLLERLENL